MPEPDSFNGNSIEPAGMHGQRSGIDSLRFSTSFFNGPVIDTFLTPTRSRISSFSARTGRVSTFDGLTYDSFGAFEGLGSCTSCQGASDFATPQLEEFALDRAGGPPPQSAPPPIVPLSGDPNRPRNSGPGLDRFDDWFELLLERMRRELEKMKLLPNESDFTRMFEEYLRRRNLGRGADETDPEFPLDLDDFYIDWGPHHLPQILDHRGMPDIRYYPPWATSGYEEIERERKFLNKLYRALHPIVKKTNPCAEYDRLGKRRPVLPKDKTLERWKESMSGVHAI